MFSKFILNTTKPLARMVNSNFTLNKQLLPFSRASIYMKDTELDKSKYNPKKAEELM